MIASLLAVATAAAASHAHPCRAALPRGPSVPAPIILQTGCGGFRLATTGRVSRLPRHWFAKHGGGTGRRYGADIWVRRTHAGRFILLRHGRVVWRSRGLYYRDGGDIGFGPHLFAFAAYRRGIFLTDLKGPERLIVRGRGLYPYEFTRRGELLVTRTDRVEVVNRKGTVLRGYRFRRRNGFTFDWRSETLYFVTPDRTLASAQGTHLRRLRRLRGVDGWVAFTPPGLLIFSARRSIVVTRLDGSVAVQTRWPRSSIDVLDSGPSVSADGRSLTFRLSNAHPGAKRSAAVVYVVHSGDSRAHALYRHRLGPSGCAVGGNMSWHGRFILYSSADGQRAVLDSRRGTVLDLAKLARTLPRLAPAEPANAYWASDFH